LKGDAIIEDNKVTDEDKQNLINWLYDD